MLDQYRMPAAGATAEIKVRGSRFIAEARPVAEASAAEAAIAEVRRAAHDATHHCSAYRVGVDGAVARVNDDGEPGGTAGAPILRRIDALGLTQTLVVVVRYYGGTKLGTGGLARAYGEAAGAALEKVPVRTCVIRLSMQVRFRYEDTAPAMRTLSRFDVKVKEETYTAETRLVVGVRRSQAEAFRAAFVEALGGRGEVTVGA